MPSTDHWFCLAHNSGRTVSRTFVYKILHAITACLFSNVVAIQTRLIRVNAAAPCASTHYSGSLRATAETPTSKKRPAHTNAEPTPTKKPNIRARTETPYARRPTLIRRSQRNRIQLNPFPLFGRAHCKQFAP